MLGGMLFTYGKNTGFLVTIETELIENGHIYNKYFTF